MTPTALKRKLNAGIQKTIAKIYFDQIPLEEIGIVFDDFGIDSGFMNDGTYLESNRTKHGATWLWAVPGTKLGLSVSFYRMESGKWEIVSYVN